VNQRPLLIAIALTLANLLSAQELSHTTAPRVIAKVDPVYSDRARLLHLEGDVILRVIVGIDGRVRNPQVMSGYVGSDLEQSAIDAVQKWRFAPGTKDGKPVEMPVQVEVNFRIPNKTGWRTQYFSSEIVNCQGPGPGLDIQTVVGPNVEENASSANATVTFGAEADGKPYNIRVLKSSDDGWASEVAAAVAQWRFTPINCNGRSFGTRFIVLFVRGAYEAGTTP
jgi:TonB family protein